jgi:Uri superfamily endonuclease
MSMAKGVYVLVISVGKNISVNVGALGGVNFEKGLYAYVGSAQKNLEKRIERHLRRGKRKFWHIDYLLDNDAVEVVKVFYKEARKTGECKIATKLCRMGVAATNFGCSDCKCASHLFRIRDCGFLRDFMLEAYYDSGLLR